MASFSGLGIGLSFVFGCIFLGLMGELYYIWHKKKKINNRGIENHNYTKYTKYLSNLLCFHQKPESETDSKTQSKTQETANCEEEWTDPELGITKKGFGEEGLDSELIRLHNLCGPPRFLFTINEETKEDLESDDGRSRGGDRSKSLADFLFNIDTPILTPLASPKVYNQNNNGINFNPLFGGLTEAEVNRTSNSPPPKFKFLREAEEKFMKKKLMIEEGEKRRIGSKVAHLGPSPLSVESI